MTFPIRAAEEKQNGFCLYFVTNKVTLRSARYSACVVYTGEMGVLPIMAYMGSTVGKGYLFQASAI